jgi:hypothetical protein
MGKKRQNVVGMEADILDFLTLSQLLQLFLFDWSLFEPLLGSKEEFQQTLHRIVDVRNQVVHGHALSEIQSTSVKDDCNHILRRVLPDEF